MRKAWFVASALALAVASDVVLAAEPSRRISGPHSHENISVYFIHGPSSADPVPLTLAEALAKQQIRVIETGNVNALAVENLGKDAIFIQSGDIVKGGQQDRVLTISMMLPSGSGKVTIDSFCVEAGRWSARGVEDVKQFSSSGYALPSREAKLAMRSPSKPQTAAIAAAPTGQADSRNRLGVTTRPDNDTSERQRKVWLEVARIQDGLSANVGARVAEPKSSTSLQLSLENDKLDAVRRTYTAALESLPAGQTDIVGFAFAIDGRINSADIYPSNGLFAKMWTKLLTASVTEAVGARNATRDGTPPPTVAAVMAFIESAEAGKAHDQTIGGLMKQTTRDADTTLFVESASVGAARSAFVHRNYLAK